MGPVPPVRSQMLAGAPRIHGEEGGQDLRHGRRQGVHGAGPPPAARRLPRAGPGAQRQQQLARAPRAQQGREDVPPLQERCATHQVNTPLRRN